MSGSVFTPNLKAVPPETKTPTDTPPEKLDVVGGFLLKVAQYAVLILVGFVAIFFTPGTWASVGFDKTLFAIVLCAVALIATGLLALRSRSAQTVLPVSLGLFWGVVAVALLSAVVSGDIQDSLVGSVFGPQSAGFLAVLAVVMSAMLVLQRSKIMTMKALAVFGCMSGVLLAYTVSRILFGADFLPLGSFTEVTQSPFGGFNDLALFSGLVVMLSLITLLQLPLRGFTQGALALLVYMGLAVLAVVNFFSVWVVIGFFGLLLFVYVLSRDTLFSTTHEDKHTNPLPKMFLVTTAIVCVVSTAFIISGEYLGNKISSLTGVEYIEVRPSVEATIDITKSVYDESVLFGVGPNRFEDAWRLHKNVSINETIFWDTDFQAGSGYIPTLFVTLGAFGAVMLILFHGSFLLLGYRMFLRKSIRDSYWYYFGIFSFTGAVFLWGMSYIYVPGVSMLLLAAIFTGCTFVAYRASPAATVVQIPLANSHQRGFFLMAAIIIVITATVGALFAIGQQYTAQASFAESRATAPSAAVLAQAAATAFERFPDDRFMNAQAQIQLATLNSIMAIPEPTEADQEQFMVVAEQAGVIAQKAVQADPTNPDNHAVLAGLYSTLAAAGFEGAATRAVSSLETAQQLDPSNPTYKLIAAQMALRAGDIELARAEIAASLKLKRNYTQALYLSAQLDISQGNVASAISTTQAIIALEPNNPTRYFQLGVLFSSNDNVQQAITAFQAAIVRDPEYANARYFLALAYVNNDQSDLALEQLAIVQQTNQENQELAALIAQIQNGETVEIPDLSTDAPVSDGVVPAGANPTVSNGQDLTSDLITPVNTVPSVNNQSDTESQFEPESVSETSGEQGE
jgi:tetratricopeptide (TPR) repeat protein